MPESGQSALLLSAELGPNNMQTIWHGGAAERMLPWAVMGPWQDQDFSRAYTMPINTLYSQFDPQPHFNVEVILGLHGDHKIEQSFYIPFSACFLEIQHLAELY